MPTKKPRATITFQPHHYELLKRWAELQGVSMSALLGEFLEAAYPAMSRTVALLEAAREAPRQVREGLATALDQVEGELRERVEGVEYAFDALDSAVRGGGDDEPV